MIKKIILISCLLLIGHFTVFSQNDWKPGFVITNSGDTLHGLIDYRSDRDNCHNCYFKKSKKDELNKFSPKEIKGYRYANGKYYISKSIKNSEIEDPVFLEFLINGKANIYYFKGLDEKYYLEKDTLLLELKNTDGLVNRDNINYEIKKQEYLGTLRYAFQDANMMADINTTKLEHKSLINITKKYHNKVCTDRECVIYERSIKPIKLGVGLVYGMNNTTLYLRSSLVSSGFSYDTGDGYCSFAGLVLNFKNLPAISERFSLQAEFIAYKYYLDYTKTNYNNSEDYKKYLVNIPLFFNYRLSSKKIYPEIGIGASTIFVRNDRIKTQNMSLAAGLSLNYEFYKDHRVFIHARFENRPKMIRFGGGFIF